MNTLIITQGTILFLYLPYKNFTRRSQIPEMTYSSGNSLDYSLTFSAGIDRVIFCFFFDGAGGKSSLKLLQFCSKIHYLLNTLKPILSILSQRKQGKLQRISVM